MPVLHLLLLALCIALFAITGSLGVLGVGAAVLTLSLLLGRNFKWAAYFALVAGLLLAATATKELVLYLILGAIPFYALAILVRPSLLRKPKQLS